MMLTKFKSEYTYFVRWRVEQVGSGLLLRGWDVIDRRGYKTVAVFGRDEKEQADAICKLLNSNEEIEDGLSK